jgi:hypothetical protein
MDTDPGAARVVASLLHAAPAAGADTRCGAALSCIAPFRQKKPDLPVLQQAFLNKHCKGCNARWFAPERIRELAPLERGQAGAATFVSLEGLGRIPFSNIRRPKPLMDVGAGPAEQVRRPCGARGRAGQAVETRDAQITIYVLANIHRPAVPLLHTCAE